MPQVRYLQRILHQPDDLMDMVSNVENYPDFVNFISAMRVTKRTQVTENLERFEADASITYKVINEQFNSEVDVHRDRRVIEVRKAERGGAVRSLSNIWKFHELADGSTLVEFDVDVRLRAFPLEMLLKEKFYNVGQKVMDVFQVRASQIYEKVGDATLDMKPELVRLGLRETVVEPN